MSAAAIMRPTCWLVALQLAACQQLTLPPDPDDELPGLGESCAETGRCAEGYCADDETCTAFVADGESCATASECLSGLCSSEGLCGRRGEEGEACTALGCQSGLFCDTSVICQPRRVDGEPCSFAEQCRSGLCASQRCERREPCAPFAAYHYPVIDGACALGVAAPSRLVVTTTDFGTGAISVAEVASRNLTNDVALSSTDGVPYYHDGLLYVVNRFQHDYVDMLDPAQGFARLGQFPVEAAEVVTTNPHAVTFGPDGLGYVTLFGYHELYVFDFGRPVAEALIDRVDLSRFADADGRPEASLAFTCGNTIFVTLQRVDTSTFEPVDCELLVAVNAVTRELYDSPIPLLGTWAKQARPDPTDPTSVLLLTTGIERVNLVTGETSWVVREGLFAAEGLGQYELLGFAQTADQQTFYVAATAADLTVDVWRVASDGIQDLELVLSGFTAIERVLEIIDGELWVADRTIGGSGLRVFDLSQDPPLEVAGPLSTGLPPYSLVAIP